MTTLMLDSVTQGSILGPLIFNINMIDLFYECEENDIANYAAKQLPILVLLIFLLSFLHYRLSQKKLLIGLAIII